ncbi:MAG: HNH endonuclease [Planctomycetota bacterium]|nr:HNH endonuclease [Planctomycetota bacterium]
MAAARELGIADEFGITSDRLPINLKISARNNSGINGVNRYSRPVRRNRKTREEFWVANYKTEDGKNEQRDFGINGLGEKEALYRAVAFRRDYVERVRDALVDSYYRERVDDHLIELQDVLECIAELEDAADVFFFVGTLNNPMLDSTQKQEMLNIRIGQRRFRRLVLDFWNHKCVISGATLLLTAGHIKPWCNANDSERLDIFNGLALSPVYDRAFDDGYISFDEGGKIMISELLRSNVDRLKISGTEMLPGLDFRDQPYFQWHRENVYKSV